MNGAAEKRDLHTAKNGAKWSYDEHTRTITFTGKSAHGSTPEKGVNALEALLEFASMFDEGCKRAYEVLCLDENGLREMRAYNHYGYPFPRYAQRGRSAQSV